MMTCAVRMASFGWPQLLAETTILLCPSFVAFDESSRSCRRTVLGHSVDMPPLGSSCQSQLTDRAPSRYAFSRTRGELPKGGERDWRQCDDHIGYRSTRNVAYQNLPSISRTATLSWW